jgi:tetratricopeptide (TPR) repeat protein
MHLGLYEESIILSLHLYEKKDQLPLQERIWADILYSGYFEPPSERIKYSKQLLDFNDQMPVHHSSMGGAYMALKQYDKAIHEYEKELELYDKWGSPPRWSLCYITLGNCYHQTGQYRKERMLYKKAERDFPDDPNIIRRQAILALSTGKTKAANRYLDKYKTLGEQQGESEINSANALGFIYWQADLPDKAEEYFRESMKMRPDNPDVMNTLAFFLIDTDRNVSEGLELADEALQVKPDDYFYLDTKGWGLYKQGKYEDARIILDKSWELKTAGFDDEVYLHIEAVKKAIARQENE